MLHALGEHIDEATLIPNRNKATAIRYWFPQHGVIQSIRGEEALKVVPGLIAYGFFRKTGDTQPIIKMHADRFGYALVCADNREEALSRVKLAMDSIQIEVMP